MTRFRNFNLVFKQHKIHSTKCVNDTIFCILIDDTSECEDAEYSSANERLDLEKFLPDQEVFYSYKACNASAQDSKFGNEKYLDGKRITMDLLKIVEDNGVELGEELTFYMNSHDECADECRLR